jgi:hypothetical protein
VNFVLTMKMISKETSNPFYLFARASRQMQVNQVLTQGLLLDTEYQSDRVINYYYIHGFFVELVYDATTLQVVEVLPFKRGYSLSPILYSAEKNSAKLSSLEVNEKAFSLN